MDDAKSVTATFASELRLTVNLEGTGTGQVTSSPAGIQCGSACGAWFSPEAIVTLTPTATSKSEFREWTGDACSSRFGIPCQVTMDTAKTVGAVFDAKPVVTVTSRGGGRVTSSPSGVYRGTNCSAPIAFDELVELTASPTRVRRSSAAGDATARTPVACSPSWTAPATAGPVPATRASLST